MATKPFRVIDEKIRKRKFLYLHDAVAIREQCPSVVEASPFQQRAVFTGEPNLVRYGNERVESAVLRSAEPQYISVLPIFSMRIRSAKKLISTGRCFR